jgi:hypothetical protein
VILEHRSSLNYREFLSKIVKFKKVVDFKKIAPANQDQDDDKENSNPAQDIVERPQFDIEERIHINYRLQYLKDTVMARYIDE